MQSCVHTHKGVLHLHSLHHTFQVISSSVSHFSSQAFHLKQTSIIDSLIYSGSEREGGRRKSVSCTNWFLFKQLTCDITCYLLFHFIGHSLSTLNPIQPDKLTNSALILSSWLDVALEFLLTVTEQKVSRVLCRIRKTKRLCFQPQKTNWKCEALSGTFTQNAFFSPSATKHRTRCQSGWVNSRSSHLETCSLLSSQCDSKSQRPYHAFIPTCQQREAPYTCGNVRWSVHVCVRLCVWVCVCATTEELAVQAYSQPAFLTSLMNLQRAAASSLLFCLVFIVLSLCFLPCCFLHHTLAPPRCLSA